jgi:hypothetical protein
MNRQKGPRQIKAPLAYFWAPLDHDVKWPFITSKSAPFISQKIGPLIANIHTDGAPIKYEYRFYM